jgi:glycosyltransferase involved in cell wall biosynthesis
MSPKLVSVVIPVLDGAPWIRESIESCLLQTWPVVEMIVVDNGSRDDSLAIARSYERGNLRVVECRTPGASAARNEGIRRAQGEYFQFLDADDVLHPDKISVQMHRLADEPDSMASCAWARFRDSTSEAVFASEPIWQDLTPVNHLILSWLKSGGMMPSFGWLTPRSVIEAAGPWNESLSLNDDGEYFTRVVLSSCGVRFCEGAKGYYRTAPVASLSKRRDRQAAESGLRAATLSCEHLLLADGGKEARAACATTLMRFAYSCYPEHRDLCEKAEALAGELGGSNLPIGGGWPTRISARLFGWKATRRLQVLKRRFQGES